MGEVPPLRGDDDRGVQRPGGRTPLARHPHGRHPCRPHPHGPATPRRPAPHNWREAHDVLRDAGWHRRSTPVRATWPPAPSPSSAPRTPRPTAGCCTAGTTSTARPGRSTCPPTSAETSSANSPALPQPLVAAPTADPAPWPCAVREQLRCSCDVLFEGGVRGCVRIAVLVLLVVAPVGARSWLPGGPTGFHAARHVTYGSPFVSSARFARTVRGTVRAGGVPVPTSSPSAPHRGRAGSAVTKRSSDLFSHPCRCCPSVRSPPWSRGRRRWGARAHRTTSR